MAATLPGPPQEDSGAAPRGLAMRTRATPQRSIHQQAASRSGPSDRRQWVRRFRSARSLPEGVRLAKRLARQVPRNWR